MATRGTLRDPSAYHGSDVQIRGVAAENIDPTSESCGESLVEALAINDKADSTKVPALDSASLTRDGSGNEAIILSKKNERGEASQRHGTGSNPGNLGQDNSVILDAFPKQTEKSTLAPERIPTDQVRNENDRVSEVLEPTMTESLNAITEKFLKIDVLDERQDVSRFIAYLLDTVVLLSSKIAFLEAKDVQHDTAKSTGDVPCDTDNPIGDVRTLPSPGDHLDTFVGKVLHYIWCDVGSHRHHDTYYEDRPAYRAQHPGDELKLMGDKIVRNLDDYLDLHPNVCFLIVNEHHCTSNVQRGENEDGQHRGRFSESVKDRLRIVAPLLAKALLHVAKYSPVGLLMDLEFLKIMGMDPPYTFLFHHHKRLIELALDETYAGVLSPLLEFLAANCSKEYEEANSLFEKGVVTGHHVSKLFEPNQMIIGRTECNVLEAHVLLGCKVQGKGKVTLHSWSWKYDGNELERRRHTQTLEGVLDEEVRIADLKFHPVDYARAEDLAILQKRGREFWAMRDQAYICYTGWDNARQYHYVCAKPPLPYRVALMELPKPQT